MLQLSGFYYRGPEELPIRIALRVPLKGTMGTT